MGRGARRPKGFRDIDGILLLDKPAGMSSNQALQKVRYLFKANKAGHTGSLDPLATGMLPVCFGQATKFSSFLLDASKSYRAVCRLGKTTTTGDAEGEVTSRHAVNLDRETVAAALKRFLGEIDQIPPMHSAVKVDGQRLYKLARKGAEVERPSRRITIHALDLIEFIDDQLTIDVYCSKGTYIRTLAEDIGRQLGCGAYLAGLHRTGVHPFKGMACVTLDALQSLCGESLQSLDDLLLPIEAALTDFPTVVLEASFTTDIRQGRAVRIGPQPRGLINLISAEGGFIGIGEVAGDGRILPKRLMNTAR